MFPAIAVVVVVVVVFFVSQKRGATGEIGTVIDDPFGSMPALFLRVIFWYKFRRLSTAPLIPTTTSSSSSKEQNTIDFWMRVRVSSGRIIVYYLFVWPLFVCCFQLLGSLSTTTILLSLVVVVASSS